MVFGYVGRFTGQEDVVWKTEGGTDMLAVLSLILAHDPPINHTAVCNACGSGESPSTKGAADWCAQFAGVGEVFVIHDCDKPGQAGATWIESGSGKRRPGWATAIAQHASVVRNVVLPYPIEEAHGKDVRDWIIERQQDGKTDVEIYAELLDLARSQSPIERLAELAVQAIEGEQEQTDSTAIEVLKSDDDPHRLAQVNLETYGNAHGGHLLFWRDEWWKYRDGRYRKIGDSNLRAKVTALVHHELTERWKESEERRLQKEAAGEETKALPVKKVTRTMVTNVIDAMRSLCAISDSIDIPCWLPDRTRPNLVSLKNGLLNLDSIFAGEPSDKWLIPHSKDWFSAVQLPYEWDPVARCDEWEKFLDDVFNCDTESIEALQMWFGYLLTQDTSLQKMMMVIGEPRSGKGTIMRTLDAMLGPGAVCNPSLSQLASPFELHGLIGRSVAVIGDARLSHRADEVAITERLLSITGEDPQDVQRKHLPTLHAVKLAVRFMLFSNELPGLQDSSAAFMTRCLLLVMPNSYVGREDRTLGKRIMAEMPGILRWAIIGRQMLDERGRIEQPSSGRDMLKQFRSLLSPVSMFVEEACAREGEIETKELFEIWCQWCLENDITQKMTIQNFSKRLRDVIPGVSTERPKIGNRRYRKFVGISVKQDSIQGDDF